MSASSRATASNVSRNRIALQKFANRHKASDSVHETNQSSVLVLNLLAEYGRFGEEKALKNDSMGALIQGLGTVYQGKGHFQAWYVDDETKKAIESPLVPNEDIQALRRAHRVQLSRYGAISLKAGPIPASQIRFHAEMFGYSSSKAKSEGID